MMDLFDSADYTITGKHSDMLRQLVNVWGIFPTYVSVLPVAAVLGVLVNRVAVKDNSSGGSSKIQYAQLAKNDTLIIKAYQLVIMSAPGGWSDEERINHLFRAEQVRVEDRELFDSYVRGGIEYLNESISADSADTDAERVMNINKMVDSIDMDNTGVTAETIIDLIRKK